MICLMLWFRRCRYHLDFGYASRAHRAIESFNRIFRQEIMIATLPTRIRERIGLARVAGALFAIASLLLASSASAHAMPDAQRCVHEAAFDTSGLHGFLAADASTRADWSAQAVEEIARNASTQIDAATPCGAEFDDEDADPSFNLCFESVEEHISTLPRYIAQWRGEKEAASVVDSIFLVLQNSDDIRPRAPASAHSLGSALVAISGDAPLRQPSPADDSLMCSPSNPAQCQALPSMVDSIPLVVFAAVPVARQPFEPTTSDLSRRTRPWTDLRVGPQPGHQRIPEQPPRA